MKEKDELTQKVSELQYLLTSILSTATKQMSHCQHQTGPNVTPGDAVSENGSLHQSDETHTDSDVHFISLKATGSSVFSPTTKTFESKFPYKFQIRLIKTKTFFFSKQEVEVFCLNKHFSRFLIIILFVSTVFCDSKEGSFSFFPTLFKENKLNIKDYI